jgi:excinuclease UvrABC nuclease subunit
LRPEDVAAAIQELEQAMRQAAEALEFERAALLRDKLKVLRKTYELK